MKTKNYSRLLLAFISSISIATTVGLSVKPGWSYDYGDICKYQGRRVEFQRYTDDNNDYADVYFVDIKEEKNVLVDKLDDCKKP